MSPAGARTDQTDRGGLHGLELFAHEQRRREWLQASIEVTRSLLSGTGEEPLAAVARAVHQIAGADLTLVLLPAADGVTLMVEVAIGTDVDDLIGFAYAAEGTISGEVIRTGQAVLADDMATDRPDATKVQGPIAELLVGPLMMVPLLGESGARGALAIARECGGRPFESEDLELATSFANHAAMALELADARAYQQRMILLEDRHRIAADLHDHVLQRLFATGMSMQAMAATVGAPYAERLEQLITETDKTIAEIRVVIHDLNDLRSP